MRRIGGLSLMVSAAFGVAVSIYNYFAPVGFLAPLSDIEGTPGAALVIFSTLALVLAGFVLSRGSSGAGLTRLMIVLSLLGILGTALAAYLLDSPVLVALMAVCLLGWLLRVLTPDRRPV